MTSKITVLPVVVTTVVLLMAGTQLTANDTQSLQGEWKLVEREHKGMTTKNTDADFKEFKIVIKGSELTMIGANGGQRKKAFTIDEKTSPKLMDLNVP